MILTERLADPRWVRFKNARVSMNLFVDNGRGGQFYSFRILTTKKITNLVYSSRAYDITVRSGHELAKHGQSNCIDITHRDKNDLIDENLLTFDLVLDGKPFADDAGDAWILAFRAPGPHIFNNPGSLDYEPANDYSVYHGVRADLHQGNENDVDPGTYSVVDTFLHSWVRNLDINLVDARPTPMTSKVHSRKGHFS